MPSITRSDNLDRLGELFDVLQRKIAREGFLGHYDLNTEIEYVFRDLLNAAYGWNLENANDVFSKNQEAFDLSSKSGEVCVQVTHPECGEDPEDAGKIHPQLSRPLQASGLHLPGVGGEKVPH